MAGPSSTTSISKAAPDGHEGRRGIAEWFAFYNERRPHQALSDRRPMAVWREAVAGAKAVDMMDNASASPTAADAASRRVIERNTERLDLQLTNRIKRSPCEGPLHCIALYESGTESSLRSLLD